MNSATTIPAAAKVQGGYDIDMTSVGHTIEVAGSKGRAFNSDNSRLADEQVAAGRQSASWYNNATLEKLERWMHEAPAHLVDAVDAIRRKIEDKVDMPQRQRRKLRRNREEGDELDPQAVLERRVDGWTEIDVVRVPKHVVSIAVNLTVSSACSPQHLLYRGAAAAALADALTAKGHSVEITAFFRTSGTASDGGTTTMRVPVKESWAPLDLSTVAVALAEIGFFRIPVFAAVTRSHPHRVSPTMGYPVGLGEADRKRFDVVLDSNVFTLDAAVSAVLAAVGEVEGRGQRGGRHG